MKIRSAFQKFTILNHVTFSEDKGSVLVVASFARLFYNFRRSLLAALSGIPVSRPVLAV